MKYSITLFLVLLFFCSCSSDNDVVIPRNLEEYIANNSSRTLDEVIACAANADGNTALSYIFYYPIEDATEIKYFETDSLNLNQNDFSNYKRLDLDISDVFGGKLQRFTRSDESESWCIVTYLTDGKLHKSNPIKLKNTTKPTLWTDDVTIEYPSSLQPKFTWSDFGIADNEIYFQVIADENADFISGTYTYDNFFQFYDTNNVVLNINTSTPVNLNLNASYIFTLMAVSEDNWVNLVVQKSFVAQ